MSRTLVSSPAPGEYFPQVFQVTYTSEDYKTIWRVFYSVIEGRRFDLIRFQTDDIGICPRYPLSELPPKGYLDDFPEYALVLEGIFDKGFAINENRPEYFELCAQLLGRPMENPSDRISPAITVKEDGSWEISSWYLSDYYRTHYFGLTYKVSSLRDYQLNPCTVQVPFPPVIGDKTPEQISKQVPGTSVDFSTLNRYYTEFWEKVPGAAQGFARYNLWGPTTFMVHTGYRWVGLPYTHKSDLLNRMEEFFFIFKDYVYFPMMGILVDMVNRYAYQGIVPSPTHLMFQYSEVQPYSMGVWNWKEFLSQVYLRNDLADVQDLVNFQQQGVGQKAVGIEWLHENDPALPKKPFKKNLYNNVTAWKMCQEYGVTGQVFVDFSQELPDLPQGMNPFKAARRDVVEETTSVHDF